MRLHKVYFNIGDHVSTSKYLKFNLFCGWLTYFKIKSFKNVRSQNHLQNIDCALFVLYDCVLFVFYLCSHCVLFCSQARMVTESSRAGSNRALRGALAAPQFHLSRGRTGCGAQILATAELTRAEPGELGASSGPCRAGPRPSRTTTV